MSGPVWRYERGARGTCIVCCRDTVGMFVEGEVRGDSLHPLRTVCAACYRRETQALVSGEAGVKSHAPAYAHR